MLRIDLTNIFVWIWIISWFAAIWIKVYGNQLFYTGLLALFLVVLSVSGDKNKNKNK